MRDRIYADNAATTRLSPKALAAMRPFLENGCANPSAIHQSGQEARKAVEAARRRVAEALGALSSEIFFTSGGTESDNWAVKSVAESPLAPGRARHVVASAIEHKAVLRPLERLAEMGWEVELVKPRHGRISPEDLAEAVRPDTALVSVMTANNVTGAIQPVKELAAAAHAKGALFHTDAVQAAGRLPLDVRALDVDLLSLSAHKFHGPKGVGALFAKIPRLPKPLLDGGGQERGGRSGTENVPGVVGMAEALAESVELMDRDAEALRRLRAAIVARIPLLEIPPAPVERTLPGHVCLVLDGLPAGANIVAALDEEGIEASSASACSAASQEASHVLTAMGYEGLHHRRSLRITLSRFNTPGEADLVAERLGALLGRLLGPGGRVRLL